MKSLLFSLILLITMNNIQASSYLKGDELLLHYRFRAPKTKQEHPPVLILLHGVGGNEDDMFALADQIPDHFLVIAPRAPFELGPNSYAWFDVDFSTGSPVINKERAEKSRLILIQFINQLKEIHHFDDEQVYLGGFSQGGIMSFSVGLTRPDKIKGIIVMSGRLLQEIRPLIQPSPSLQKLQILILHGTHDSVLGIHYAHESRDYLMQLGLHPSYFEFDEDHRVSKEMIETIREVLSIKY
ncbi:alpha/beta fold hydrolase [Flavobacterium sp. SUN046]|uniref:alpha/beta hydrolase n=1 Tax=Flavobacterium sp. SUN046 TaxID=3002440 RepID=UPI002DBD99A6|nr:alpha/beta fold hydrolase [Flavobacterium sp. SUN046]MEC4050048.1 alpha/beta fold hydrolase [Flavobacterium sp. SUN046]